MTNNDTDARIRRLAAAPYGTELTVPADWEPNDEMNDHAQLLRPGDRFLRVPSEEGGALVWEMQGYDANRPEVAGRWTSWELARCGLDLAPAADEAPARKVTATDTAPAGGIIGDFSEGRFLADCPVTHKNDGDPARQIVSFKPSTEPFKKALARAFDKKYAQSARDLDEEARRIRASALAEAIEILESRQHAGTVPLGPERPVAVADMIAVAAYIVSGQEADA